MKRKILVLLAPLILAGCGGGGGHPAITGGGGSVSTAPAVPTICLDALNEADTQLEGLLLASSGLIDGFSAPDGGLAALQRATTAITALDPGQQKFKDDEETCRATG